MSTTSKDVQEILELVRQKDYQLRYANGGVVRLHRRDGNPVLDRRSGKPISIHQTPSDNCWRENTVASLIRAGVIRRAEIAGGVNGAKPRRASRRKEAFEARKARAAELRPRVQALVDAVTVDRGGSRGGKAQLIHALVAYAEVRGLPRPFPNKASGAALLNHFLNVPEHAGGDDKLDLLTRFCDEAAHDPTRFVAKIQAEAELKRQSCEDTAAATPDATNDPAAPVIAHADETADKKRWERLGPRDGDSRPEVLPEDVRELIFLWGYLAGKGAPANVTERV